MIKRMGIRKRKETMMEITEKASAPIAAIAKKFKLILIGFLVYFAALIAYDLLVFQRDAQEMLVTYLPLPVIGAFVWFAFQMIFRLMIKEDACSGKFYNVFAAVVLTIFGVCSVILGVEYFVEGFIVGAFVVPIVVLSVLRAQFVRKK